MTFINVKQPLSEADVLEAERELGFRLPQCVREHYLHWNGGQPKPDFFGKPGYTIVHEVLPLKYDDDGGTAINSYRALVVDKELMPAQWLPFAIDPFGDYFFVDCSTEEAGVIFFQGDYWSDERERCVVDLEVSFPDFWKRLTTE